MNVCSTEYFRRCGGYSHSQQKDIFPVSYDTFFKKVGAVYFEKEWCCMTLESCLPQLFCRIWLLRGTSGLLLLLNAIYHFYAETLKTTADRFIFNDYIVRILENVVLETYLKICLLGAIKALIVCSDAARHGCRGNSCWKVSVDCYYHWKQYLRLRY